MPVPEEPLVAFVTFDEVLVVEPALTFYLLS